MQVHTHTHTHTASGACNAGNTSREKLSIKTTRDLLTFTQPLCRACGACNDVGVAACQICGETDFSFFSLPSGGAMPQSRRTLPQAQEEGRRGAGKACDFSVRAVPLSPKAEALLSGGGGGGDGGGADAWQSDVSSLAYSPPPVPARPGNK